MEREELKQMIMPMMYKIAAKKLSTLMLAKEAYDYLKNKKK